MSPLLFGNCQLMRGRPGGGEQGVRVNACWADGSGQTLYGHYFQRVKRLARIFCGEKVPQSAPKDREGEGGQKLFGQHPNRRGDFDKGTSLCAFFLLFVSNLIIHVRDENSNQTRSRYACDEKPNHLPGPAGHTEMRKSN